MSQALPRRVTARLDLLRLPGLGAFLRWRYSRFALQVPLFLLALLAVYDGLTGRQIAPANTATVAVWVHYRGLVALAIATVGNLFCAACPLMLTRGPSKVLKRVLPQLQWPRMLRNKYTVLALTVAFLFAYEHFDLWASPWITAWLILGYFAAALLVDSLFPAGTFCKYVCPLGNFNFALAGASPTQVTARDPNTCESCEGKYCLNGRLETEAGRRPLARRRAEHVLLELPMVASGGTGAFPGCETDLFVPAMTSTQDCTLCMNCLRACPYDNVALTVRSPAHEATEVRPRADWALFLTVLTWGGLVNAFAMTPPFYRLASWLSEALGTANEGLLLALIFTVALGGGVGLTSLAARTAGGRLRDWAPLLGPLALSAWGGHYLYHFLTGYSTLFPNAVLALTRLGLPLGPPAPGVVPARDAAFLWQVALSYAGLMVGGWAAYTRASRLKVPGRALAAQLGLLVLFVALLLLVFAQPMEARGSILLGR